MAAGDRKARRSGRVGRVALNLGLALAALATAAPLLWMVSVSLMPTGEANLLPPRLIPSRPTLAHYRDVFTQLNLGRSFWNTAVLSVSATAISLLFNSLAGYAFAKLRFGGRDRLFALLLLGLIVPAQIGMLPLFLISRTWGW